MMESLTLKEEEEEQKESFIAFARVYSGVVKKGQRVFVLGPKYDPTNGLSMVSPGFSVIHQNLIYHIYQCAPYVHEHETVSEVNT